MFTTSTTVSKGGAMPCFLGILLMLTASISLRAQEVKRAITGKVVVEDTKQPMVGATIRVKGSDVNAKTDTDGRFNIIVGDKDKELIVSYVGFESKHIKIDAATKEVAAVGLKMEATALRNIDVYASGFQSISAERATGSFSKVDNKLFNRVVSRNVLDRIADVTSGLIISKRSGQLNPLSNVDIRGVSTINANKQPLLVVDNFPYDGNINDINPNDIESVTVLKDAASASIWGVQAGNGVIVLTTKKGRYNQPVSVQLNTNVTIGSKPNLSYLKTMSSRDEIDFEINQFKKGLYNDYDDIYPSFGYVPVLPPVAELLLAARRRGVADPLKDPDTMNQIEDLAKHDIRDDIKKHLLQTSISQQYAVNISGGGENYNYYASVGYDKSMGNQVGNNKDERLSLRLLNRWRPLKALEIKGEISHTQTNTLASQFNYANLLPTANYIAPYTRLADNNGNPLFIPKDYRLSYVDTASYPSLLDWHYYPLNEAMNSNINTKSSNDRLVLGIRGNITKDLDVELNGQYQKTGGAILDILDQNAYDTRNTINKFMTTDPLTGEVMYPIPLGSSYRRISSSQTAWNLRGQVNFQRISKQHAIFAMAGLEFRQNESENFESPNQFGYDPNTYTFKPVNNSVLYVERPGGGSTNIGDPMARISGTLTRYGSYFVNSSYTYESKYTVYASGRLDQSNFFGVKTNDRIKPLWSSGIAWEMGREPFYKVVWLPQLKLKASYGYNGNTNNSGSAYPIATYSTGSLANSLITVPFASVVNPANPGLKWERVKIVNFGVEFASKQQRITGSIEYYKKWGLDLISNIYLDPTTGFSRYLGNNASIKGSGIDITINTKNLIGEFKWHTTLLLSTNKDEVTSYTVIPKTAGEYLGSPVIVGKPLNNIYSYNWAGLNHENGDAQLYIDGKISPSADFGNALPTDLIYGGPTSPRLFGAINNSFIWRNLTLSFNVSYRFSYYFRRNTIDYTALLSGRVWGGHADYANRWKKPGDELSTDVPSQPANPDNRDMVYRSANVLVTKGDVIRLQDIRLDYQINRTTIEKLPVKAISAFIYANNIGIIWKANKYGIDPEYRDEIPVPRSVALGINVNF